MRKEQQTDEKEIEEREWFERLLKDVDVNLKPRLSRRQLFKDARAYAAGSFFVIDAFIGIFKFLGEPSDEALTSQNKNNLNREEVDIYNAEPFPKPEPVATPIEYEVYTQTPNDTSE